MKKHVTLILLAGYPGTGKTYLANLLMKRFPEFSLLSPDALKEKYWDEYGFDTEQEKEQLIAASWEEYYRRLEEAFRKGQSLISDYPFSKKQKERLRTVCESCGTRIVTIRLTCDLDVLYERQKKRDQDSSRHPGHVFTVYHKGAGEYRNEQADGLLDYDEFIRRCTTRGYGEFTLGKTWEIDVSDFQKADYGKVMEELETYLQE